MQAWIVYLFIRKLKILQRKYPFVDDSDLFWSTLQAIHNFKFREDRRYVASRFVKNIEYYLSKRGFTDSFAARKAEKIKLINMSAIDEKGFPSVPPNQDLKEDETDKEKRIWRY